MSGSLVEDRTLEQDGYRHPWRTNFKREENRKDCGVEDQNKDGETRLGRERTSKGRGIY